MSHAAKTDLEQHKTNQTKMNKNDQIKAKIAWYGYKKEKKKSENHGGSQTK